ncbi:biotin/lipoyl-binding protein [Cryobacterium levicorallinum]|uniref:Biotin/lipoyl-binding protein n=1 Tax=Cryobacterium levicorallinum TaxID=995038 RepID=A0A1I2YPM7_9MICO|nr:biotin/lipoyl-binding protein [Cryobacterium levicorallinum]TFB86099.1 biotin/lipoyl-binding protein [Cryobacterium levicorallinum]GEP27638.1 hemolysin D [Cryobacterium levicorallinum]SFH27577.1 membrane fusion protein, macrolide-specific efflux system [Cryobacterium levicorallinum]
MKLRTRIRQMKAWWWVLSGGVIVLALIGGGAWWFIAAQPTRAEATPATQTVAASLETMQQSVTVSGTLTPTVQEEVSFAASGNVTGVNVAAGTVVQAGDVLATVDTLTVDAELLAARATLASAAAKLADSEVASDTSTADLAQIAANEASVTTAQNGVDEALAAQAAVTLTAPVAGLITVVNVAVGEAVSGGSTTDGAAAGTAETGAGATTTASSAAFTIVGTDSWTVDFTVGETDAALIAADNQVELALDDGTEFFGTVSEVGLLPATSTGVAAYPVVVVVTGSTEGLYDGVAVTADIVYERRTDVLTVASAAVTSVDGASVVTVLDADGNEVSTPVTVGATIGDLTEITEGLAEGDEVVMASFTPGSGNTGTDRTGMMPPGDMPTGDFPAGQMPGGPDNG